jgi:hypothetical protein
MRLRCLTAAALLCFSGCKCSSPPPPPPAPAPKAETASDAPADAKPNLDDEVRPVYASSKSITPLAKQFCDALNEIPTNRLAECCGHEPAPTVSDQCARVLASALTIGALHLSSSAVDKCQADIEAKYQGCGWVSVIHPPIPASCVGAITGTLKAGEKCRSTHECADNMHCLGSGPTDKGVCGPARGAGGSCLTSVDALDAFLSLGVDTTHPECTGYCDHHRCFAFHAVGTACTQTSQCGPTAYCSDEKKVCVAGPAIAKAGERCEGRPCEGSLRCIDETCQKPKPDGAPCHGYTDCQGACAHGPDGGFCAPMCPGLTP